ncbi:hypothetical protein ABIB75_000221 [Bradyrhizobium sp. GM2.2]
MWLLRGDARQSGITTSNVVLAKARTHTARVYRFKAVSIPPNECPPNPSLE